MDTLISIASQFSKSAGEITPLGNGLINDTYLVTTHSTPFVLQRINRTVFPAPELIMDNLATLNWHIEQKDQTFVRLQIPKILKTGVNGLLYQDDNGDCWRALSFIANTKSLEHIGADSDAEQVGRALGHFHRLCSDLNPLLLHDTLPGFHITPEYLKRYHAFMDQSAIGEQMRTSRYCAEFIARSQFIADDLEAARQQGLLSIRVIHGDPKLNNFLFDKQSRKIVSLIDLDTVKPGLVHYDLGDCARSCCHVNNTDRFDIDIFAALLKSYLSEASSFFTGHDYLYLYRAIRLIPFELGLRFYTDYLQGNPYFKVTEPGQNLHRAIAQFRLCESIMAQEPAINSLILQLQKRYAC